MKSFKYKNNKYCLLESLEQCFEVQDLNGESFLRSYNICLGALGAGQVQSKGVCNQIIEPFVEETSKLLGRHLQDDTYSSESLFEKLLKEFFEVQKLDYLPEDKKKAYIKEVMAKMMPSLIKSTTKEENNPLFEALKAKIDKYKEKLTFEKNCILGFIKENREEYNEQVIKPLSKALEDNPQEFSYQKFLDSIDSIDSSIKGIKTSDLIKYLVEIEKVLNPNITIDIVIKKTTEKPKLDLTILEPNKANYTLNNFENRRQALIDDCVQILFDTEEKKQAIKEKGKKAFTEVQNFISKVKDKYTPDTSPIKENIKEVPVSTADIDDWARDIPLKPDVPIPPMPEFPTINQLITKGKDFLIKQAEGIKKDFKDIAVLKSLLGEVVRDSTDNDFYDLLKNSIEIGEPIKNQISIIFFAKRLEKPELSVKEILTEIIKEAQGKEAGDPWIEAENQMEVLFGRDNSLFPNKKSPPLL